MCSYQSTNCIIFCDTEVVAVLAFCLMPPCGHFLLKCFHQITDCPKIWSNPSCILKVELYPGFAQLPSEQYVQLSRTCLYCVIILKHTVLALIFTLSILHKNKLKSYFYMCYYINTFKLNKESQLFFISWYLWYLEILNVIKPFQNFDICLFLKLGNLLYQK